MKIRQIVLTILSAVFLVLCVDSIRIELGTYRKGRDGSLFGWLASRPENAEAELNEKLERLSELNALLNMDEKGDAEAIEAESEEKARHEAEVPTEKPSIIETLRAEKEKIKQMPARVYEKRQEEFAL